LEFVKQIREFFPEIQEYWVIARRSDRLQAISVPGIVIKPLPLDLTDPAAITTLQAELAIARPTVSLLIGNAGCGYLGNFDESTMEEQLRMVDLNIRALTAVTHAVLPYMEQGGRIINLSSIASFVPNPRMTIYSATKSYVSAFSRGLHEELKPRQISVTAVCPGPMDTEFIYLGAIKGNSKTFDRLPYCKPDKVAKGALKAAKKGRMNYTPHPFYKLYKVLAKFLPVALVMKMSKT
jgi:short-subunit dehydrogenase